MSKEIDTRKPLIAEYKRTPKEMGVYQIRNTVNSKCYIASSRDIRARFNRHRMNLKTNTESIKSLLSDWLEYGSESFEFEILEILDPLDLPNYDPLEDLKFLESIWLEKLCSYEPKGYNKFKQKR